MFRTLIVVMLLALPVHAEEFGAWRYGTEVDSMTEKRKEFVIGTGSGLKIEVICKTYESQSEYKDLRKFNGKRYLTVWFVADSYLGDTLGIHTAPAALFRVDSNPALEVDLGPYTKNTVKVLYGDALINKLLDKPGKQLRVRLWAMDNNKYEYTLSLDGMPTAIGHLKKECGMTPENTYRDNDGSNSIRPVK
jgi:hypothetical protein